MMSKNCKCIKNYTQTAIDYLGNKKHSEIYDLIIFQEGKDYLWANKGNTYYVSSKKDYLRDINRWNIFVEEIDEDIFKEHFITN